jgi:hypothetical protein
LLFQENSSEKPMSRTRTLIFAFLVAAPSTVALAFAATVEADAPNRFQKDRWSSGSISTAVYSCHKEIKQSRPDVSERVGFRNCSCITDYMQARINFTGVASLAEAQKRIVATPGFLAAAQRCVDFAIRTQNQSGAVRGPYTPPKELSAGQIARRFDKCYFSLARGKSRDGVLDAMNYCECKVDAQRAGYGASRAAELCD